MNTTTILLPALPSVDDDFWRDVLKVEGELPFPETPVYPAGEQFLVVLAPSIWRDDCKLRVTAYLAINSRFKGHKLRFADFEADSDWFDCSNIGVVGSARNAFLQSHSRLVQVITEQGQGLTVSWVEADTPTISLQVGVE